VPLPEAAAIPGQLRRWPHKDATGLVRAYEYQTNEADYRFFFAPPGKAWNCGSVASDAAFVCLTTVGPSQATAVILCDGSYVELEGKRLLTTTRRVARCELLLGETPKVFCSEPEAMRESSCPMPEKS
jgi:hypothetical protein